MENKKQKLTVGLLLIATGKYDFFLPNLIESVGTHFFPGDDIIIYLFGDKDEYTFKLPSRISIVYIPTKHQAWPASTLFRYRYFTNAANKIKICNYAFYCDADMIMVGDVDSEILSTDGIDADLIVTRHPGFWNNKEWGSQNVHCASTAFLNDNEKHRYVAGGFNGGKADKFLEMSRVLADNIDNDYNRGLICEHNDETHLNCFVNKIVYKDFPDWKVKDLTPSYCMLQNSESRTAYGVNDLPARIIAIDKDHAEFRK